MDSFWKYRLDHIIFWVATVSFHMFTRLNLISQAGFDQFLLEVILRNTLLAIVIYGNIYVLIPFFAQQRKWLAYGFFLLLLLAFYVAAKNTHDVYLYGYHIGDEQSRDFFYNSFYNLSIAIFYLAFSVALQLSREWYGQRSLIRKIEVEKLNTELEYLKAQINPHFLFNSINTIYFQIDKQNTAARELLSAFSDMLRYQLYECNVKEIPVEKEVTYLRNYVELQRMRKDENYKITFSCGRMGGFTIAPLLLLPFVENAFKHVSHFSGTNLVKIAMCQRENVFQLNVLNTKDSGKDEMGEDRGIGLRNVRRRLDLLYNGRHTLIVLDKPDTFEVDLQLTLS